jgi:hypothetical protein
MFKVNHLFGGNGSVPSFGGTSSLAAALSAVERAEAALAAARALAKAAAKREGVAVRGLFEDSQFILRATGEKWVDQARGEGKHEGVRELHDCMLRARGLDPEEERAKVAASIKRDRKAAEARTARWDALMRDAGWHDAVAAGDHARAGRIAFEMHDALTQADAHVVPRHVVDHSTGKTKADQILRAGRKARMSVSPDEVPPPEPGSLAEKIIQSGQRRRGEIS